MKLLAKLLIIALIGLVLAVWSPWISWEINIPNLLGYTSPEQYAGLTINSLAGTLTVYIEDVEMGQVVSGDGGLEILQITPGGA